MAVPPGYRVWTCGWDGYGAGIIYHRVYDRPDPDPVHPNYNIPWWLEWAASYQGMYGIAAADNDVAWSVGYQGYILKTSNGGIGWGPQASNTGSSLNDVVALSANTAWAVGDSGTIVKTTDGGANWIVQTTNTSETFRRIAAYDTNNAWAVGTNGIILHTTDGGTTWTQQYSGTHEMLAGVAAVSATTAWVVGDNGVLVATTDGGSGAWAAPTIAGVSPSLIGYQSNPEMAITITGTGFRGGNLAVTFGSTSSRSVTWISPTTILALAPLGLLGTFDVTVTNEDGQSAMRPNAGFYVQKPTITGFSPYHGPASGGYQITLTGSGLQDVVSANLYIQFPFDPWTLTEYVPVALVSPTQAVLTIPVDATRPAGNAWITLTTAQNQDAYINTFVLDPPTGPVFAVTSVSPLIGWHTTSVTINGVGFSTTATAEVCGKTLSITSRSSTQLVGSAYFGNYERCDVNVYSDSDDLNMYQIFLSTAAPTPTVSTINPSTGPAAGNTTVTITGTGFNHTGFVNVTFGGYQGTITSKTNTSIVLKTPPHRGGAVDVSVVVTDPNNGPVSQATIVSNGFMYEEENLPRGDFDGDLKSDILWRHNTAGEVWLWPMNGTAKVSENYVRRVADTDWEIRGLGDQDGDGRADILWRNKMSGQIYFWPMNGSVPLDEAYVGTVDPAYDIVGTGDFNADGKSDILWRHIGNGDVWIWLMNGAVPLSEVYVGRVDPGYVVKGVGDLNGDSKADIVWHHSTSGEVWVWLMNGTTKVSETQIGTVPDTGYQIKGVADFTGDGNADILWWHASRGEVWIWTMNGTTRVSETWIGTVGDTGYRIVSTGDYNGDRKADILWHHASRGEVWMWPMNGTTRVSETWIGTVGDTGYQIVR
jgi:photosystem II stability/assembly factor-like uncharacterized protein